MIGMVLLLSCACLCGVSLYAYYSKCDPLALGVIKKTDQVIVLLDFIFRNIFFN